MLRTRRVVVPLVGAMVLTGVSPFAAVAEPAPPEVVTAEVPLTAAASEAVPAEARAELPEMLPEVAAEERALAFATADQAPDAGQDAAPAPDADQAPDAGQDADPAPGAEPTAGRRTEVVEAPVAFTSVYVELPAQVPAITARVSRDGEVWEDWVELEGPDPLDGPDEGSEEFVPTEQRGVSQLLQTDAARFVQLEVDAEVDLADLTVRFMDVDGLNEGGLARVARHLTPRIRAAEASSVPSFVQPRSAWGARSPKTSPSVARGGVRQFVVHHTAGQNNLGDCSVRRIKSTIRGIQNWHMDGNGWNDIGYNLIVDPCGGIWEGRAGGADRAVIGAHAANFNTGSSGVSVLGDFRYVTPNSRTLKALDRVIGWKAGIHDVDTTGWVEVNGAWRPTVVGHRDVGNTTCPGSISDHLPRIRRNANEVAKQYRGTFSDTHGHTHEAAIERLVKLGIAGGYGDGTFRPNGRVTRAQVATFVTNTFGIAPQPGPSSFRDLDRDNPHSPAVEALVELGIMRGYDGKFRPQQALRRDHMAVVLTRAMERTHAPQAATFLDVLHYRGQIGAMVQAKVAAGYGDGTYRPLRSVTRGQMATFMVKALDAG